MKAIIMAGGEGSRLRPLTCDCPKPMVRVMDKPVMEYALMLVKRHGVEEAAVTLRYLPDAIVDYFGDGEGFGIKLRYYTEKTPLGTAGGVKQAQDFLTETFCVLSGDGLTDLDLSQALAFHRERGAMATVVLKRCENPLEYGVVVTDAEGRIKSFMEKPAPGEVVSEKVNTGVYILEPEVLDLIPDGVPCDFGGELFPQMVERGMAVYGCAPEGYWCDVGDVKAYLKAHRDILDGRFSLGTLFPERRVTVEKGALVDEEAILEAPCYIGAGAKVMAGARVGAYSALGAGSVLHPGADVKRSVLWKGAEVASGAQARGCVLTENAALREQAQAFEESALGTGAVVGKRSTLLPGVRVWPGKRVPEGVRQGENLVWGALEEAGFSGNVLPVCDPQQAAKIGRIAAEALKVKECVLAHGGSAVAEAMYFAVLAGLMAQGVSVLPMGCAAVPEVRFALGRYMSDMGVRVDLDGIRFFRRYGAALSRKEERTMTALLLRQDCAGPFAGITRPPVPVGQTGFDYAAWLAGQFRGDGETAPRLAVFSEDARLLDIADKAFLRAGIRARCEWEEELMELSDGEVGVWLSEDGETARFAGADGPLSEAENQILLYWTALEMDEKHLLLHAGATKSIETLAKTYAADAETWAVEEGRWQERLAREFPAQFILCFDALAMVVSALSCLQRKGLTLEKWRAAMPKTHRVRRNIPLSDRERTLFLERLTETEPDARPGGGVSVEGEGGWALIGAGKDGRGLEIMAEAVKMEAAEEMVGELEKKLRAFLNARKEKTEDQASQS